MTRCGRIYPIHSDTCLSWAALLWQRLQQLISAWSEPQTLTWCKKVNKCRQKSQQTQNCQTSWPHLTGDLAQADNRRMHISLEYGCNSLVIPFITWSTDSAVIATVLWVYSKGTYLRAFKCFQRFHRNTWRNLSVRFCRCLRLSENLTETGPPNNLTKSTVDQQVTAQESYNTARCKTLALHGQSCQESKVSRHIPLSLWHPRSPSGCCCSILYQQDPTKVSWNFTQS